MVYMLKQKQSIILYPSKRICIVENLIGVGGQAEVYRATLDSKSVALKWYYPHAATADQKAALETIIRMDAPSNNFLWPSELVSIPNLPGFGYIMPLREARYKSLIDLMRRKVNTTFRTLTTTVFHLVDSYVRLHSEGLCYRDISFGNVFFDPNNGDVLICDNDNIVVDGNINGGILGTSRFMAPEIVRGEALPSIKTDLFSLSVLIFYLLIFHHPFEGKREADIHVFDMAAMTKIYGTEPIFIFDPHNRSNEPVRGYQDNALIFWPIYPQFLRDLFTRAFTDGLTDPENGRIAETEWQAAFVRLRDSIYECISCHAQNFYDEVSRKNESQSAFCWNCKKLLIPPFHLRINDNLVMLNPDTQLFPHHIDGRRKYDFSHPIAEVIHHPTNPNIWGLKNLSTQKWVLLRQNGSFQDVDAHRSLTIEAGKRIDFGDVVGEICY